MIYVLTFVLTFIFIFLIYLFYYVLKAERGKRVPIEAQYVINWKRLNTKLFNYRKFILTIALVTSFDMALVVTLLTLFKGIVWQILFGLVISLPVIIISFMIIGNYYSKKQLKDNSKELESEKKYLEKLENRKKKKESKRNSKTERRNKK